jgi:hypothetical protein
MRSCSVSTRRAKSRCSSDAVLTQCQRRHRHQEFLRFLAPIEASVPRHLDVHLALDNYATHKHPKVRTWLAARWFGHITQRAIRRGSFRTVRGLVRRIEAFVTQYNATSRPFAWTATADSILAKLERLLKAISRSGPTSCCSTAIRSTTFGMPGSRPAVMTRPRRAEPAPARLSSPREEASCREIIRPRLRSRSRRGFPPRGLHLSQAPVELVARKPPAAEHHAGRLRHVLDVLERVAVHQHHVGPLARGHRAGAV